jgi:hypothetical protein
MINKLKYSYKWTIIILLMIFTVSCVPTKQVSYFSDLDELSEPGVNPRTQKLIMPFDKLYIKVISIDPQYSQIFNATEEMRSGVNNGVLGYLVDEKGNVNFTYNCTGF